MIELEKMIQEDGFPLVEGVYCESSNVNGDTTCAYAITKVKEVDEATRLDYLTKLLMLGKSLKSLKPVIISGVEYASTEKWTVADNIISTRKHDEFQGKKYIVIWLENENLAAEYHGNAGYTLRRLRGMALHYYPQTK